MENQSQLVFRSKVYGSRKWSEIHKTGNPAIVYRNIFYYEIFKVDLEKNLHILRIFKIKIKNEDILKDDDSFLFQLINLNNSKDSDPSKIGNIGKSIQIFTSSNIDKSETNEIFTTEEFEKRIETLQQKISIMKKYF